MTITIQQPENPKDLRYRQLYFPNADAVVFDTARKGSVPLPILLQKLMRHLSAPEFRALVSAPARQQVRHLLSDARGNGVRVGLGGTKNLVPYLKKLEEKKLISTKMSMGKKFYLVHDPRIGLQHLIDTGVMRAEELEELNQLCFDLSQEPFEAQRSVAQEGAVRARAD